MIVKVTGMKAFFIIMVFFIVLIALLIVIFHIFLFLLPVIIILFLIGYLIKMFNSAKKSKGKKGEYVDIAHTVK